MGRTARAFIAAALIFAGIGLAPGKADATGTAPARILILGDSVTQGGVGDYTWRYRLWNTLQAQRANVDFVGPASGVSNNGVEDPDGYADPNFDRDHAAWSGTTMMWPHWNLKQLVADYRPDVIINDLGINDLCFTTDPDGLVAMMWQFVADARSVRPHVTIILGQMTQRWLCDADAYNAKLASLAASLDTPAARVVAATAPADYVEGVDTKDTRHPNASGEVKIAAQFATAMTGLIPAEHIPDAYTGAARLRAIPRRHSVRLAFTRPAHASSEVVWIRNLDRRGQWHMVAATRRDHLVVSSLKAGHRYAFRVQARAYDGALTSSGFSNVVRLRTRT